MLPGLRRARLRRAREGVKIEKLRNAVIVLD
jgi:hypothetical protein